MKDIIVNTSVSAAMVEIVLNRPHRRNALTGPMVEELISTLERLIVSTEISVIILRGAEGAFCSGLDLKEFSAEPPPAWVPDFLERWKYFHSLLFECPKIILGAIEGPAINAGSALALACDLLVVGRSSFLQVGEIQRGMAAPMNLAWLKLRHSEATAARLALVGDPITGNELVTLGVAHECVDDSSVVARCTELANRLAQYDVTGATQMKRALRQTYSNGKSFIDFHF